MRVCKISRLWCKIYGRNWLKERYSRLTGCYGGCLCMAHVCVMKDMLFVLVVLSVTADQKGTPVMCGLTIGLALVLVHVVCIPITGMSVNPACSIAPVLFAGGKALSQLWLFIVTPFVGAALSA